MKKTIIILIILCCNVALASIGNDPFLHLVNETLVKSSLVKNIVNQPDVDTYVGVYFVDNSLACTGSCSDGNTDYNPDTRTCGSGESIIYTTIEAALESGNLAHGTTSYIRAGTYQIAGNETIITNLSGTASSAHTLQNFNSETVIWDAPDSTTTCNLRVSTGDWLELDGVNRTNSTNAVVTFKRWFPSYTGRLSIKNCYMENGTANSALFFHNSTETEISYTLDLTEVMIRNCKGTSAPMYFAGDGTNTATLNFLRVQTVNNYSTTYLADGVHFIATNSIFCPNSSAVAPVRFPKTSAPTNIEVTLDNCILVGGGTSRHDGIIYFTDDVKDYFNSNPSNLDIEDCRFWNLDSPWTATIFRTVVYCENYNDYVDLPQSNTFQDPGFDLTVESTYDFSGAVFDHFTIPTPTADRFGFAGDSIMWGYAGGGGDGCDDLFSDQYHANITNETAISGMTIDGMRWFLDYSIQQGTPETVAIAIGMNNISNAAASTPLIATAADHGVMIGKIMDRFTSYGVTPMWLGITPEVGDSTQQTRAIDISTEVESFCVANGYEYTDIFDIYKLNADWETDFFDISDAIHPNTTGHQVIADTAWTLYSGESFLMLSNTYDKFLLSNETDKLLAE